LYFCGQYDFIKENSHGFSYPEFKQWRDSFGADYKDWYLHPKE
jgi:hypothetical protein